MEALNTFDTTLYGGGRVEIPTALASASGFTGLFGLLTDGMTFCSTPGTPTCFNGIVMITNETSSLYYRTETQGADAVRLLQRASTGPTRFSERLRDIDTLGASGRRLWTNNASAVDLFRYDAGSGLYQRHARRLFLLYGGVTNGADGATYNTLAIGEDYADFTSNCAHVQDATGCLGRSFDITNDGGSEINILDAVGYERNAQAAPPPLITSVLNGATGPSIMAASTYVAIYGTISRRPAPGEPGQPRTSQPMPTRPSTCRPRSTGRL